MNRIKLASNYLGGFGHRDVRVDEFDLYGE
jgi:hypothetical protein